jgi:hypothetical protein
VLTHGSRQPASWLIFDVSQEMRFLAAILALIAPPFANAAERPPVASPPQKLQVGKPAVFEARSPNDRYAVVFEDDGDTGYFYALNFSAKEKNPIQEAMSIYDVKNVADRAKPSEVILVWTADSGQAALFINSYPHAVFDFAKKRGYCRTDFPKPGKWGKDFKWDDSAIGAFKSKKY